MRGKAPAIKAADIQQTLRAADDEIRAHAADTVTRFVKENYPTIPPEDSLVKAATPFMEMIWPQERQLTTPSISKSLADLPAVSGKAFTKAVALIERFLVPFDCWSMLDYGLWGDDDGKPKLANIDTPAKAAAFLHLLDLTVGANEGAVIPHDLGEALARISEVSPPLSEQPSFRRLSAAAR